MANSESKVVSQPTVIEAPIQDKAIFYCLYYSFFTCIVYFYYYLTIIVLSSTLFDFVLTLGFALAFLIWDMKLHDGRAIKKIFNPQLSRIKLFHEKIIIENFSESTEIAFSEIERIEHTRFLGTRIKLKNGKLVSLKSNLKLPLKLGA